MTSWSEIFREPTYIGDLQMLFCSLASLFPNSEQMRSWHFVVDHHSLHYLPGSRHSE